MSEIGTLPLHKLYPIHIWQSCKGERPFRSCFYALRHPAALGLKIENKKLQRHKAAIDCSRNLS